MALPKGLFLQDETVLFSQNGPGIARVLETLGSRLFFCYNDFYQGLCKGGESLRQNERMELGEMHEAEMETRPGTT